MNKQAVVDAILLELQKGFENFQRSSRSTRAGGNDAESKSEGKYDTRSTEENYLADGLAHQAQAMLEAARAFEKIDFAFFDPADGIDLGALLEARFPDETIWFFMGPAGGGTEVTCEGRLITVITPDSPLGAKLMGKKAGEKLAQPLVRITTVL